MIKEKQMSLAPYLTVPGPGRKEAFPFFLCPSPSHNNKGKLWFM